MENTTISIQELVDAVTAAPEGSDPTEAVSALIAERKADPAAVRDEAAKLYKELRPEAGKSAESLQALEAVADVIKGADVAVKAAETEAAERNDKLAALDAVLDPPEEGGEPADVTDDTVVDEAEEPVIEPEPVDEVDEKIDEPELIAASANKAAARRRSVNLAALPRTAPPVQSTKPAGRGLSITASADVPGIAMGTELTADSLTAAVLARFGKFPENNLETAKAKKGLYLQAGIAQIKMDFPSELTASAQNSDQDVLDHAGDPKRRQARKFNRDGALTAAGGWCSPSEVLYELCPGLESATAGLIDVPEIGIPRGGIRTTEGPDFASLYSSVGFKQTEAQAIAGDPKPCFRVPCPTWTETRAGVTGVCIESGILQDDAYPEGTRRTVEVALAVHAHKFNADTIAEIVAQSTPVAGFTGLGASATSIVLNSLELQIVDYRYRYRADENLLLELKAPIWLKAVIRSDLALRTGIPFQQVTDQQIMGFFADRGADIEFVYDWQDAFTTSPATPPLFGNTAGITAWPAQVKVLIYAAGAFVRGRGQILNMEGIYDTTNLEVNDFTKLFLEEKFLVRRRCYQSRVVTLNIPVNGATGCCVALDAQGNPVVGP